MERWELISETGRDTFRPRWLIELRVEKLWTIDEHFFFFFKQNVLSWWPRFSTCPVSFKIQLGFVQKCDWLVENHVTFGRGRPFCFVLLATENDIAGPQSSACKGHVTKPEKQVSLDDCYLSPDELWCHFQLTASASKRQNGRPLRYILIKMLNVCENSCFPIFHMCVCVCDILPHVSNCCADDRVKTFAANHCAKLAAMYWFRESSKCLNAVHSPVLTSGLSPSKLHEVRRRWLMRSAEGGGGFHV